MKAAALFVLASATFAAASKKCVVPASGGQESDSPAIQKVFGECSTDATIIFKEGVTYNVFEPIEALELSNVVISVQGNLDLPQDIPSVQKIVADAGGKVYWFNFKGQNVKFVGSKDVRGF